MLDRARSGQCLIERLRAQATDEAGDVSEVHFELLGLFSP